MISRTLAQTIQQRNHPKKAVVVMGPRQAGKSTLLKHMLPEALWLDGDEPDDREFLTNPTSTLLLNRLGNQSIVVIDEAQRIRNIGVTLKLITDKIPGIQLYVSGSSSFELSSNINEPLTGRKWDFNLLPLSFEEMINHHGFTKESRLLPHRLIYGYYPEVVTHSEAAEQIIKSLTNNYLYKDVLGWERIQKPDKIERLVQALALQVGQLVSYHELAKNLGIRHETIENYIQILENAFIVFRVPSLAKNLRNELVKSRKIFFYDNGVMNAVNEQFKPLSIRSDAGMLWENFLISERKKHHNNHLSGAKMYFWRTKDQSEIDYVEELGGEYKAYEFKWNKLASYRFPKSFMEAYKPTEYKLITPQNLIELYP